MAQACSKQCKWLGKGGLRKLVVQHIGQYHLDEKVKPKLWTFIWITTMISGFQKGQFH